MIRAHCDFVDTGMEPIDLWFLELPRKGECVEVSGPHVHPELLGMEFEVEGILHEPATARSSKAAVYLRLRAVYLRLR